MALLVLSSTVIAAACIGMGLCVLNGRRFEREEKDRVILIARLALLDLRDEQDMLRLLPAVR